MNERRRNHEKKVKSKFFPNRDDEDHEDEDAPLLLSSSGTKSEHTIERSITRNRRSVHPRYAKKIQNERITKGTVLSRGQSDYRGKSPFSDLVSSLSPSLMSYRGCCCVQCVRTKEVGILECFGEFNRVEEAGLICIPWPCLRIPGRVSLRVQQLDITFEGKTKDNVFITIKLAILYQIPIDSVHRAFYILEDPKQQLKAYVYDVVRSTIALFKIDDLFLSSDTEHDASLDILRLLQRKFSQRHNGYYIMNVLITEISPDAHVMDAMNEIIVCKKWKESMAHKAEAEKLKIIRIAEAESDTSYLRGIGTAKQRDAIAKGMQATLVDIEEEIKGKHGDDVGALCSKDVIDILLISQYYDTITCISGSSPSSQKSIILHHSAGVAIELQEQLADLFKSGRGQID